MQEIFNLINEMSPYLLLGFGIAGLMHTFVPSKVYSRYLSGRGFRSVFYAAALGVPLPLCSCGEALLKQQHRIHCEIHVRTNNDYIPCSAQRCA